MSYFQFGGTYLFDEVSDSTAPFIALTAGVTRFEPGLDDIDAENYFSWSLGGGVQLRADRRIGVRLEARLFGSIIDDESALFCVSSPPSAAARCPSKATSFTSSKHALASWRASDAGSAGRPQKPLRP